jgi:hypothetical protein
VRTRSAILLAGTLMLATGVLGLVLTSGAPRILGAGRCAFRVLGESTGLPVKDAVVSAFWSIRGMEGARIAFPHVDETLTGEDGVAVFPAWGPRLVLTYGEFRDGQPEVRVISKNHLPAVVRSSGCLQDIQLRPMEAASIEQRAAAADELMDSLWEFYRGKNCDWTKLPLTVRAAEDAYAPYRPLWLDGKRQPPFSELKNREVCGEPEIEE